MKQIPWKGIALGSLTGVLLIVVRSLVTVGKAIYYGMNWRMELLEDPWFYVGMVAAAVGFGSLVAFGIQEKSKPSNVAEDGPEEVMEMTENAMESE